MSGKCFANGITGTGTEAVEVMLASTTFMGGALLTAVAAASPSMFWKYLRDCCKNK